MSFDYAMNQLQQRNPAAIELETPLTIAELPTPALILDLPKMRRNIAKMASHLNAHQKGFRPHGKTHKCPLICQEQLNAGAVGVCAAKVSEAAAFIAGGISDVLITSPIATLTKAKIIAGLTAQTDQLKIVVDSDVGLDVLFAALGPNARIGLLIDVDVAMGRTGMRSLPAMLRLVERIEADPRTTFAGLQHYAGHVMHINGHAERRVKSLELWQVVQSHIQSFIDHGFTPQIVTGGGTGTYDIDIEIPQITDLQVGSYAVMDEEYRQVGSQIGDRFEDFEVALTMACTMISQPMDNAITVDGGYKAFASDTVPPVTEEFADTKFRFAGDEHGVLISKQGQQAFKLGDVVELVTPHCDPTVNLHDQYWVREEDGLIHRIWPITARGCTW